MAEARPAPGAALRYALTRLRRGWRSGELLILALALAVAVAAASAVGLFTDRVRQAIANQTGESLGADAFLVSRDPLPDALLAQVAATGARMTPLTMFPSVVLNGEQTSLASIKAVAAGYPLRGILRIADEPFAPARAAAGIPPPGEAWVDLKLWAELGLKRGATVQAGSASFRVTAIVDAEPDRGGGFMDFAPRFLINAADLAATALVTTGSRAQFSAMIAGTPPQVAAVAALTLPRGVRRVTPQDSRPEIRDALARAGQFLDIAILAAILLASAAIALCAHQYGHRLRDEAALLKCLGARQSFIAATLLLNLLLLGVVGGIAGAAVGWAAQAALAKLIAGFLDLALPAPNLAALPAAWALGLTLLVTFAAPPILQARRTPPIRVFQREYAARHLTLSVALAAIAGIATLLWWQTGETRLAGAVLGAAAATLGILALLAWLLVLALAPLRRSAGTAWRFGLANVARRRGAAVAQAAALGLALHALLMVSVVRQDLLSSWRDRLPADAPNQFLINIQPAQAEPLVAFFAARGVKGLELVPMARGRLVEMNGKAVTADSFDDPETQRWINRDFNLSWADALRPGNTITAGEWWTPADHGKPWLSVDQYAVDRLHLALGDRITLDFAGQHVEFTIRSTRKVEWDSFKPNFFLVAPPGVLDQVPYQLLTSLYLPPERRPVLRELIAQFPNVTPLDLGAMLQQVRTIADRIVAAVEFIFLFTLAAGLAVILAAVEGTRGERVRETALLRALGARTGHIVRGLVAEYATLGLLAGSVAAISAQAVAWVLADKVFHIEYGLRPLLWVTGAGAGALLVTALGALALRPVLATPPHEVLRGGL